MVTKSKAQASVNPKQLTWKSVLAFIITLVVGLLGGGVFVGITSDGEIVVQPATMELADEQIPAILENEDGEAEVVNVPTVESIDGGNTLLDEKLDFGRGAYHDISSPLAYKDAVIDVCTDLDGLYGSQCVDLWADFHYQYTGRWLSTCGTGAAYGLWDCKEQNAGEEYELITDPTQLQLGDWIVFSGGLYGHIAMAMGPYNNGYIAILGQNQGGKSCPGGGSSANIINMSLNNFRGAFRPKIYIKEEPKPIEPQPSTGDKVNYTYVEGDTFGQVILDLGLVTDAGLWGEFGDVEFYTKQLIEQDMLDDNGNIKLDKEFTLTKRMYI